MVGLTTGFVVFVALIYPINHYIYKAAFRVTIMRAWQKVVLAAVFLAVLFIPILTAATTEKVRMVIVERHGYNLTASVFEVEGPAKKNIEEMRQEYLNYKNIYETGGSIQSAKDAFDKIKDYRANLNITSIKDANLTFLYRTPFGTYEPVPGCERLTASNMKMMDGLYDPMDPYDPLNSDTYDGPYYYTTCSIPMNQPPFNGTCKDIIVRFVAPVGEKGAYEGTESVCDNKPGTLNVFAGELATILTPSNPACISGVFLIGLLFASMFFSGKSPLSLLDLTTPRLPSPKGIAASGQVLGPFGYAEMKMYTNAKVAAALKALGPYATKMGMNAISATVLTLGNKYGAMQEAQLIARKGDKIDNWRKQEHEAFGKLMKTVEQKAKAAGDKKTLLDARILQDWYIGKVQFQRLEALTEQPGIAVKGRIVTPLKKVIHKPVERLPMLGPLVAGSFDSIVRSGRIMTRFATTITASPIRAVIGDARMRMLEEKAKKSASSKALYEWLSAGTAAKLQVGGFYPIKDRAAALYKGLHDEAYHELMKYALKQLYQKYGMKFNLTLEELSAMALADERADILARVGFKHNADLVRIEDEIRNILSKSHFNAQQKYEMVVALLAGHGIHIDASAETAAAKLQEVEKKEVEDHVKLIMLYEYLSSDHKIQNGREALDEKERNPNRFAFSMGYDRMASTEYWENLVLRRMIYDIEKGMLNGGHIEDIIQGAMNDVRNRVSGIRQSDVPALVGLLTEEGRAKFQEYYGFDAKANPSRVTVEQILELMYGKKAILAASGAKEDYMAAHVEADGRAQWWGSDKELGPDPRLWKIDMKRNWEPHGAAAGSWSDLQIATWVENRFTKSHVPPYNADIERKLNDKYANVKTWTPEKIQMRTADAKKMWVTHLLGEDLRSSMNSLYAQNAYGQTNETVHFYSKVMAAFLAAMLREKGVPENDAQIRMLEAIDMTKKQDRQRLAELIQANGAEFTEFLKKPVTYSMMSKTKYPMVMLHEGGIAPYIKGMTLSDYGRPLSGRVALQDNEGRYRQFDPDHVRIDFKGRQDLEQAFGQVNRVKDKGAWEDFLRAAKEWAGTDFERQKVFNGVLWRYANTTDDWKGFWRESAITIKPKREVMPMSPLTWRMFSKGEIPGIEKLQNVRNYMIGVGDFISRASLAAAGPVLEASYAITPFSEYYRSQSWRLAHMIKSFDNKDWDMVLADVASPSERERLKRAYNDVAMAHFPYHMTWDYAIDRNPWRTSTSYGSYQNWGGFFHMGPINPFPLRSNYRAVFSKGEYIAWELQNWPIRVARQVALPFQHVVRAMQQAMQGYPSRWDQTFSPMRPWDYTPVRIRDFVSALNPLTTFFSSWTPAEMKPTTAKHYEKVRNYIFKYEMKNPAEQRDLAGQRIGYGQKQAPMDIFFVRKGVYASARTGEANPGCSYYDYRFVLQLDNCMAEYLAYRAGEQSAYFKQNQYVMEQALKTTVKREVAAEALALRREHELRGFGVLQNPIYGWFAPPLFLWHMPFLPQISPKELLTGAAQRARFGGIRGNFSQMAKDMGERFYYATNRGIQSWKSWKVSYCPNCQTPGYRGTVCRNCKQPIMG